MAADTNDGGGGICTAIFLTGDKQRCTAPVTNTNGLFCRHHSRQAQRLYQAYKHHSTELENLNQKKDDVLPRNYAGASTYESIEDVEWLTEIHEFLRRRLYLLYRCIVAREYHHTHFYADNSDFGHQKFLEQLRSLRKADSDTLEHIERRKFTLDYEGSEWLKWTQEIQNERDRKKEQEARRVKAAARIEKLHRERTRRKSQEEEEEETKRRQAQLEKEEIWDPLDLILDEQRSVLVEQLLWLLEVEGIGEKKQTLEVEKKAAAGAITKRTLSVEEKALFAESAQQKVVSENNNRFYGPVRIVRENGETRVDWSHMEDPELREIVLGFNELIYAHQPYNTLEEAQAFLSRLEKERKEIRMYILLRCIAASPTLLAAALESESLEEFLNDTNGVTATDLRNLVVSLEGASNEAIRDACADYWNADLIADVFERDIDHPDEISISSDESSDYSSDDTFYNKSPSKRNKQVMTVGSQTAVLKVGGRRTKGRYERRSPKIAPSPEKKKKKRDATTIELFGYTIYKSRIETRVGRQGWYQFAAMTGCSSSEAIKLCRNWNEFFELSILSQTGYFHGLAQQWGGMPDSIMSDHFRRIGFVTYYAETRGLNSEEDLPNGSRGIVQARNYLGAVMSRESHGTRRFISMLQTYKNEMLSWVWDALTGQPIYEPPESALWLTRFKDAGRKNAKWQVTKRLDRKTRAEMLRNKEMQFNFRDYLDIVIIDAQPGRDFPGMMTSITSLLNKAHRYSDQFAPMVNTLDVFQMGALLEEGKDHGPLYNRVKDLRMRIKDFRPKNSSPEAREKNLQHESPDLYYTDLDKEIDEAFGCYDNDSYWFNERTIDMDDELDELMDEARQIEDLADREEFFLHIIGPKLREKEYRVERLYGGYFESDSDEYGSDDDYLVPEKRRLEAVTPREASNTVATVRERVVAAQRDNKPEIVVKTKEEWEDAELRGYFPMYMWEAAEQNVANIEEWSDAFADDIYSTQLQRNPSLEKSRANNLSYMKTLVKKRNLNERERRRMRQREEGLRAGPGYISKNLAFVQLLVNILWLNEKDAKRLQVKELGFGEAADVKYLRDVEQRARFPPPRRPNIAPQQIIDDFIQSVQTIQGRKALCGKDADRTGETGQLLLEDKGKALDTSESTSREMVIAGGEVDYPEDYHSDANSKELQMRIHRLWNMGAIEPSYNALTCPSFVAHIGDHPGLFVDYGGLCFQREDGELPEPPPPGYLLDEVEKWHAKYPDTTYSLLRIKSEDDYWPFLDLPGDTAEEMAFSDPMGRSWQWKYKPKDMPSSECDVHQLTRDLLDQRAPSIEPKGAKKREEKGAKYYTRARIDLVLVLSETSNKGMEHATFTAAYLRKVPSGIDIDWARSFLNVDAGFLRRLSPEWWM